MHRKSDKTHPHHHSATEHFAMASVVIFALHPLRVGITRAPYHSSVINTIKDIKGRLVNVGLPINILRGGFSSGAQSYASHVTQRYFDHSLTGKFASLLSASLIGTITAASIEAPFIRTTEHPNIFKEKISGTHAPSFFKFNRPIITFFFMREVGFSGAVLLSKDLSPITHYSILLSAAWLTASCQKLATIEINKDLTNKQFTVPDYSKGMRQAISNVGKNVYTLPSLRRPIVNPTTFFHRTTNILKATCGLNMFLFRLAYLKAFAELLTILKTQLNEYPQEPSHLSIKKVL